MFQGLRVTPTVNVNPEHVRDALVRATVLKVYVDENPKAANSDTS